MKMAKKYYLFIMGKYAQAKGEVTDPEKNLVLISGPPSPFSAHLFFGK